jgi:hypothetical protein
LFFVLDFMPPSSLGEQIQWSRHDRRRGRNFVHASEQALRCARASGVRGCCEWSMRSWQAARADPPQVLRRSDRSMRAAADRFRACFQYAVTTKFGRYEKIREPSIKTRI